MVFLACGAPTTTERRLLVETDAVSHVCAPIHRRARLIRTNEMTIQSWSSKSMAMIREFTKLDLEIVSAHSEAPASYCIVTDPDGARCLQIDTYGSEARKLKGKKSQSIRLSPDAIAQLKDILRRHF